MAEGGPKNAFSENIATITFHISSTIKAGVTSVSDRQ